MNVEAARLRRASLGLAAFAVVCAPDAARAAAAAATFTVTANVVATCHVSVSDLAFGIYVGVTIDSTATLTVTCTESTPYYVNVGDGSHRDASNYPRMIGRDGALLSYRLFQNVGRTVGWRNTYNLDGQSGIGSGGVQTLTLYGRFLPDQSAIPGSYSDAVVVQVTY